MKYVTAKGDRINWQGTTILHGYNFLEKQYDGHCSRWQGWPSGESTFLQCGPGSISALGVICGLSLLVLYSAMRGFSPGTLVFPSHQKPTFDFIRIDFICE